MRCKALKQLWLLMATLGVVGLAVNFTIKVFERLNALYMPRLYLISPDGTLRYLSPMAGYNWRPDRWQEELEHIGRLLGR